MYLTTPQILSLFSLAMSFTRDSQFELVHADKIEAIIDVHNVYGTRGFRIPASGGTPEPLDARSKPTAALQELVSSPDTEAPVS